MFAETHIRVQEMWGGGGEVGGGKWGGRMGGMGGAGDRGWGDLSTLTKFTIWWPHVPKSPLEHTIPEILQKSLYYLSR